MLCFINTYHLEGSQSSVGRMAACWLQTNLATHRQILIHYSQLLAQNRIFSKSLWTCKEADVVFWKKWNAFWRFLCSCKHWKMSVGKMRNSFCNHRTPGAASCNNPLKVIKWGIFHFLEHPEDLLQGLMEKEHHHFSVFLISGFLYSVSNL